MVISDSKLEGSRDRLAAYRPLPLHRPNRPGEPVPPPPLPPPVPVAGQSATSVAAVPNENRRVWAWTFSVPSWLVSAILHLAALLILALITIPLKQSQPAPILLSAAQDDAVEVLHLIETVRIEAQLEKLSVIAPGVATDDVVSADLGESLQQLPKSNSDAPLAEVEATWDDLGVLFGTKGSGLTPTGASGQGAQFFGVKASGRKFVFIVDSSNSMKRGKFDAARAELSYALRRLDKDQFFYIIFFDQDAARMTFAPSTEPEERAARANIQNIQLAEKWMSGIQNELRTDPYEAVKFAVEMLPDAIYILTDGKFTDKGKTERYLASANKLSDPIDGPRPKVVVHTVGFYQRDGEETLQRIAKEYGGTYRFVPAPPGFRVKK